jgi:predicted MPP superfamily phosphohydrolase
LRPKRLAHGPGLRLLAGLALGALASAAFLSSCATASSRAAARAPLPALAYPRAAFVVISDPHVYESGPDGLQAERSAATERAGHLYGRSSERFHEAISRAIELLPDFVLLSGDLTKDGELPSHERVRRELERLSAAGVRAYVVPGNHDVENPRSMGYAEGRGAPLPSPSRKEFAELYAGYGYGDALSRDPYSLSYVAQLLPGLRLLAIDPFRRPPKPDPARPEPEGFIGGGTMAWIRARLDEAGRSGEAVIAMSHLSLLEHFEGQAEFFPASLPRGREELASLLASRGVRLVFTGHFHMQDVVRYSYPGGGELYDIATGSLAYYPMPYRIVELDPDSEGLGAMARVRSFTLPESEAVSAAGSSPPGEEIRAWVASVLAQRLRRFLLPRAEAEALASSFSRAYLALVAGDESPGPGDEELPDAIGSLQGRLAKKKLAPLLRSLWRDLPPEDNDLVIELETPADP